jgi:hypothetical protein
LGEVSPLFLGHIDSERAVLHKGAIEYQQYLGLAKAYFWVRDEHQVEEVLQLSAQVVPHFIDQSFESSP